MNSNRLSASLALVIAVVLTAGCAAEKPGFPTATLQGTVKVTDGSGQEGTVQFMPARDVKGQVAQATITDGKFVARNVPIGKVRVIFNITRKTGKMITEYSTPYPEVENLVPDKFQQGIDLDVTGDDNVSFDLTVDASDSTTK